MKTTAFISGLVLAIAAGGVLADDNFLTLKEIPAEAMTLGEMDKVQGKNWLLTNVGWLYMHNATGYLYNPNNNWSFAGFCGFSACNLSGGAQVGGLGNVITGASYQPLQVYRVIQTP